MKSIVTCNAAFDFTLMMQTINRRDFLTCSLACLSSTVVPACVLASSQNTAEFKLYPQTGNGYFLGAPYPRSTIWCYNQLLPGPQIRVKQGQRIRIQVNNRLDEKTTLHCHGIRLPIAMDGVPGLTQPAIDTDETFVYEFDLPDAGTYWYHPHFNSAEQVGRGLYGALIIEEAEPIQVDRDLVLILDDWRLTDNFQIQNNFNNGHDRSHGGRIGNTITVNGRENPIFPVRRGERLRLRLINAANARTFSLDFSALHCRIIAIDGHPVTPHEPENSMVTLAAAMRMDLIVDMMTEGDNKDQFVISDSHYQNRINNVFTLSYTDQAPIRDKALTSSINLPANTMPEPDLTHASQHDIELSGGAMGGMRGAIMKGEYQSIRQLVSQGMVWAMNGTVGADHTIPPLLSLKKGQTCLLRLVNNTAFDHPMHLHGHAFRVLKRDGKDTAFKPWQDTVNVLRNQTVEVAFVADNPGQWMFHCHILEHQLSGMSSIINIS